MANTTLSSCHWRDVGSKIAGKASRGESSLSLSLLNGDGYLSVNSLTFLYQRISAVVHDNSCS